MSTATLTPAKPAKEKRKYRLLAGTHIDGTLVTDEETGITKEKVFHPGDIIESARDLSADRERYELIGGEPLPGHVLISTEELERLRSLDKKQTVPNASQPPQGQQAPDFAKMSDKDLRAYADDKEIDVTKCKTRDELLKAVKG